MLRKEREIRVQEVKGEEGEVRETRVGGRRRREQKRGEVRGSTCEDKGEKKSEEADWKRGK